jgi:predicted NBD/HSP70 family sugar kinase
LIKVHVVRAHRAGVFGGHVDAVGHRLRSDGMHERFEMFLADLGKDSNGGPAIGREVLGEVLARVAFKAPEEISRVEIADRQERRSVDRMTLTPGTVSKAVKVLLEKGLLEVGSSALLRSTGRPVLPLRLGSSWTIAGVKVTHRGSEPVAVIAILAALDGTVLKTRSPVKLPKPKSQAEDSWPRIAEIMEDEIRAVKAEDDAERMRRGKPASELLGAGVEVGGHVHDGQVILSDYGRRPGTVPLAQMLENRLHKPVVVENDVSALAVLATHHRQYQGSDMVIAAVYDEGVGGGLVMDGRVRRGGHGMAMELGHLLVEEPADGPGEKANQELKPDSKRPKGFSDRCWCNQYGHVEVLATPSRIRGELGVANLEASAAAPSTSADGTFTREYRTFDRAGAGLGRGLTHTLTIVNPKQLILKLPSILIEHSGDKAASAYLNAVRREVSRVFSTAATETELTIEPFDEVLVSGARAAAICVGDAFIEHLRGLDSCRLPSRRSVDDQKKPEDMPTENRRSTPDRRTPMPV